MNIFWCMKILWIFFFFWGGGSSQTWTIFMGSFLYILGSFLKVKVQNGDIF